MGLAFLQDPSEPAAREAGDPYGDNGQRHGGQEVGWMLQYGASYSSDFSTPTDRDGCASNI